MSNSRVKRALFTAAAAIGVTAGAAGLASAATTSASPPAVTATASSGVQQQTAPATGEVNDANDSPSYTSSVTVANGADNGTENDTAESARLAALATVTADQATQAATAAVPGTPATPVLENENGNVVYSVHVTTATGVIDVKVDAGNGKVVAQDQGDNEGSDSANEAKDGAHDVETNDAPATGTAPTTVK
jgi:uncharacterized membrane protein YkoI